MHHFRMRSDQATDDFQHLICFSKTKVNQNGGQDFLCKVIEALKLLLIPLDTTGIEVGATSDIVLENIYSPDERIRLKLHRRLQKYIMSRFFD